MADKNLRAETPSANARIPINQATVELLWDVQADFQTAGTLLEAIDHFVDDAQSEIGPCAEKPRPELAAKASLHAMVMIEQLRDHLSEAALKLDGAVAAIAIAARQ